MGSPLTRRARWVAPIAVAATIGLGAWIPTVTASAATPDLHPISAAKLLAKAAKPTLKAFSGRISFTANLGLPNISGLSGGDNQSTKSAAGFDPTTLLSGTHEIDLWVGGPQRQRVALPSSMAETDFVHNGDNAYLYSSSSQAVTHFVRGSTPASAATPGRAENAGVSSGAAADHGAMTPEEVAQGFLDHIDPTTTVSVASPVYVAKRATYQLVLSPKAGSAAAAASTIGQVAIDVDSRSGLVLSVVITGRNSKTPALSLAYSTFSDAVPAASNFAAPIGKSTKTETLPPVGAKAEVGTVPRPTAAAPTVSGSGWAQVVTFADSHLAIPPSELNALTAPVAGSAARLFHTNLVNALVFPDGRVSVGFVTPGALEAAPAS